MIKEKSIHFKVIHRDKTSLLRGIVFLEESQKPTLNDVEECLRECGHEVILIDKEHLIFKAFDAGVPYLIHVLKDEKGNIDDISIEHHALDLMQ
ncbi:hypothetical protein A8990_101365 [Paenibacillus taihuensis]|uniref:Uncharacterized protein n=1 Tax=Paenibacillus taihuensis TaxID=1156355 RepID=A0A3D9SF97_9BACL|nr:hypothetical protein [Paenibacillus taihuensis]REE94569.1 hypothetical protein A8990_101365 [Paenibacillus taihuensis]